MKILHDFQGRAIRLTDERLAHILEHPEMDGMERAIEEALVRPERVVESSVIRKRGCTIASTWARVLVTSTSASSPK